MSFNIKTMPFGTTLARQVARQHLYRFNNVFWYAERSFKHAKGSFADIYMPPPGPTAHGVFPSALKWEAAADEFRIWSRQHVLVSAAGLLEVYVKSASLTALLSSPELIDRSLLGVDGVTFIKFPSRKPNYLEDLLKAKSDSFINQHWFERFRRLSLTFGALPPQLTSLESKLQSIQTKRNKIAHQFGQETSTRRAPWELFKEITVGQKEVIESIKTISKAIKLFDDEVFGVHIGGHEVLHEYHVWSQKEPRLAQLKVSGNIDREFRRHIGRVYGRPLGSEYIADMVKYYDAIM